MPIASFYSLISIFAYSFFFLIGALETRASASS